MPTTTARRRLPDPQPRPAEAGVVARALLAGAAGAGAELLGAAALGFLASGHAEPLLFFAMRPWVLFALAAAVAERPWHERRLASAVMLVLAAASETLLLRYLGAEHVWRQAGTGLAAGAVLALAADLIVQLACRFGRRGRWAVSAAALALLLASGRLLPWTANSLEPAPEPATVRPKVALMSGLPLAWGEGGPLDPASRPAEAYRALSREFDFVPLDTLEPATLARAPVLFLAQPQRLAPSELAALDAWIRGGGRALILADPELRWPSQLALGDIRRPPPVTLLSPLLDHWGLSLETSGAEGPQTGSWEGRRLVMERYGRFRSSGTCGVEYGGAFARCPLGRGLAFLVADADLMRDDLWAPGGDEAYRRTADNPLFIADRLDALLGLNRERADRAVAWARRDRTPAVGLGLALLPILAAGAAGLLLRRRRKR